jgi:hypothetical protein
MFGIRTRHGGPVRMTETFLQLGRALMQADRSGVGRQLISRVEADVAGRRDPPQLSDTEEIVSATDVP